MPPNCPPDAPPPASGFTLIRGGAVCGFGQSGGDARPGAVVASAGRVIDAGPTTEINKRYAADAEHTIDLPGGVLLPGMVNAHTHLQLTAIGPQPYTGGFVSWIEMLRRHWPGDGEPFTKQPCESWFVDAVADGAQQCVQAGVQGVGDITRFDREQAVRRDAGLSGISFIELFGHGPPFDDAARERMRLPAEGFQPHAPYSAGPSVFDAAAGSGAAVSCHLAETLDELRFVRDGDGPFLELLKSPPAKWDDGFAANFGRGLSPVAWMEPHLRRRPWLLAHCNYVSDADIALLAETGASVAYCPIASEYFGHENHRYREMLEAGVNVCLGTDSIVCQPPEEPQPLGILPQMRRLHRRDGAAPERLLRMATTHGRAALRMNQDITRLASVAFDPGDTADALTQVLRNDHPVEAIDLNHTAKGISS